MSKYTYLRLFSVLILFLLGSPNAIAADPNNFYVGASLGATQFSGDGPRDTSIYQPGQKFEGSDGSYGSHAGFQFTDWFALELGYVDFGNASHQFRIRPDVSFIVAPNDRQTVEAKGASLSGVFSYGLSGKWSLLGTLGITAIEGDAWLWGGFSPVTGSLTQHNSFSDQGLAYGLGAKYALSDSLSLRAELRRNEVGELTLDISSIGFEYTF